MLYCFLICLGIWLVIGFITFVKFINKYKEEVLQDTSPKLILVCLGMCICGIVSPIIIYHIEQSCIEIDKKDIEEKINEDG